MSLFIGNLSARTRRDELERVFRRFGQCEVRLKDGYGFVVYSFAPQAEKALKVLQGRRVCGQQVNMTWSNKQPRPVPRNPRGHRPYEARSGRDFALRTVPSDYRENPPSINHPNSDRVDDEDIDNVVLEMGDNGRWGERVENDSDLMADRYEPYHGYERREGDESRWMENSGGGSRPASSQDNFRIERDSEAVLNVRNGLKFRLNCFSCGELGHKARDCTKKQSSQSRFVNKPRDDSMIERSSPLQINRSRRETRSPKRHHGKKSKRSASVSADSEYRASRSPSRVSLKSVSRLRFSKSVDSKSRSRSRSPIGKHPVDHGTNPESKDIEVKLSNLEENKPKVGNSGNANAIPRTKVQDDTVLDRTDSEAHSRAELGSVTSVNSISLEEMCVALKHFGVEVAEKREKHESLEEFFGSARLWPWEGIYYRRVKKGPISVENYSKRVAQNREFGIVDKYVRSSSGWGEIMEMYQEQP